jgi:hypothetical protein
MTRRNGQQIEWFITDDEIGVSHVSRKLVDGDIWEDPVRGRALSLDRQQRGPRSRHDEHRSGLTMRPHLGVHFQLGQSGR